MVWNSLVLLRRGLQMDCSKMESESSVFSWREYIWEISQERFTTSHTVVEINNMKRASRFRIPYQHKTFSNEVIKKQQDDKKNSLGALFRFFAVLWFFLVLLFLLVTTWRIRGITVLRWRCWRTGWTGILSTPLFLLFLLGFGKAFLLFLSLSKLFLQHSQLFSS